MKFHLAKIGMETHLLSRLREKLRVLSSEDYIRLRRFSRNFTIGFGGSIILLVIAVVRTALLTKNMLLEDFGKIMILLNVVTFLNSFLLIRVSEAIYRFYPELEQTEDYEALGAFLILCLLLSFVVGLVVAVGLFILAPFAVSKFYSGDETLIVPLRILSLVGIFLAFEGFSTAVLRLKDRFLAIVLPQVIGNLFTVIILLAYLVGARSYSLEVIIAAFAVGLCIQAVLPLAQSIRSIYPLVLLTRKSSFGALADYRRPIFSTIFHANISGYFKLLDRGGAVFLLGIFSTPAEVALYALADQLTRPMLMLQNNIQTAITPEIVFLWTSRKFNKLYKLLLGYVAVAGAAGTVVLVVGITLARPVILLLSKAEYLDALPIFKVLLATVCLIIVSLPFYILSISMDKLRRRNTVMLLKLVYLIVVIISADLNAILMAAILFFGELTVRVLHDAPLLWKVRYLARRPGTISRLS